MTFTLSTTTRLAPIVLTTLSLHDALPIWLCSAGSSLLSYRDIDCRKQWAALFLLSRSPERRNSAAHCFLQSMSRYESRLEPALHSQIGRASCRDRVVRTMGASLVVVERVKVIMTNALANYSM